MNAAVQCLPVVGSLRSAVAEFVVASAFTIVRGAKTPLDEALVVPGGCRGSAGAARSGCDRSFIVCLLTCFFASLVSQRTSSRMFILSSARLTMVWVPSRLRSLVKRFPNKLNSRSHAAEFGQIAKIRRARVSRGPGAAFADAV